MSRRSPARLRRGVAAAAAGVAPGSEANMLKASNQRTVKGMPIQMSMGMSRVMFLVPSWPIIDTPTVIPMILPMVVPMVIRLLVLNLPIRRLAPSAPLVKKHLSSSTECCEPLIVTRKRVEWTSLYNQLLSIVKVWPTTSNGLPTFGMFSCPNLLWLWSTSAGTAPTTTTATMVALEHHQQPRIRTQKRKVGWLWGLHTAHRRRWRLLEKGSKCTLKCTEWFFSLANASRELDIF